MVIKFPKVYTTRFYLDASRNFKLNQVPDPSTLTPRQYDGEEDGEQFQGVFYPYSLVPPYMWAQIRAHGEVRYPLVYIPTVFDNYSGEHTLDGKSYILNLWDTAGQEEFEKLRPLSYPGTNAFILCFALDNKVSFDNISIKWVRELKYYCQKTPIILVGTKNDVTRNDSTVSGKSAIELCKKLGLAYYVECSAKTLNGIDEVFNKSIMAAVGIFEKQKFKCFIL